MKKLGIASIGAFLFTLAFATAVFALVTNGNFEAGDFSGWTKGAFINQDFSAAPGAGGSDLSVIVGGPAVAPLSLSDANTGGVLKYPAYGHYSARVNSAASYTGGGFGKNANTISQSITAVLTPSDNLAHVRFTYAAVMVNPVDNPHTADEKPYFRVTAINTSNGGDVLYDFSSYVGEPGKNWQSGVTFSGSDSWQYLDWDYIDLASSPAHPVNAGDVISLQITAAGCSLGGHPGYVYVDEVTDGDVAGPSIQATGPATVLSGATITYTYSYHNGSSAAIDPTIQVTQPTGVTFTSVSDTGACSLSDGTVTCNYSEMTAGTSGSFTISGTVIALGGAQIAHGEYSIAAPGFPTVGGQTILTDVPLTTVTIDQAVGQVDPTGSSPILFTAVFSNPVTGFTGSDVDLSTGTAGGPLSATVSQVAPNDGTTYQISVTGMSSSGTVVASIPATVTVEGNAASTSSDDSVTFTSAAPEIQVLDGTTDIADGTGSVDFGTSQPGTPILKTFTVTNNGTSTLTLTAPITLPSDFSLVATFGSTSLAPAASTTFQVQFDAKAVGVFSGQLSFANNDADENPFNFTITGKMGPALAGSTGLHDGWILESGKGSGEGGTMNNTETIVRVGDNARGEQYRSILSYKARGVPSNATIVSATLKLRKMNVVGTDPLTTHGALIVDIAEPYFGVFKLELSDFAALAGMNNVGRVGMTPVGNYYQAPLKPAAFPFINRVGYTQFRLRFTIPTNNDGNADILSFYSGDVANATPGQYIPLLEVNYTIP